MIKSFSETKTLLINDVLVSHHQSIPHHAVHHEQSSSLVHDVIQSEHNHVFVSQVDHHQQVHHFSIHAAATLELEQSKPSNPGSHDH